MKKYNEEKREISYSSKTAAKNAMWKFYDENYRVSCGNPLIGSDGEQLRFTYNGKTRDIYINTYPDNTVVLVKSWIE